MGALPAGRYAEVLHRGHFDGLVDATAALPNWADDQRLAWHMQPSDVGEVWGCTLERFLTDPMEQPDPNQWETTLTFRTTFSNFIRPVAPNARSGAQAQGLSEAQKNVREIGSSALLVSVCRSCRFWTKRRNSAPR